MKKKKLNYKNILKLIVFIGIIVIILLLLSSLKITNIYIKGNNYYKDYEIMNLAKIEDYPNSIKSNCLLIKHRLEKDEYIISAKVSKRWLTKLYIEVEENYPIFYNATTNQTIMFQGILEGNIKGAAYLTNYIPDYLYDKFEINIRNIDKEVIDRFSEIKYDPNEVDTERFLITTNDGNYIYINMKNWDNLNLYKDLVKKVGNKKGVFYLDSGNYFKIMED